MSRISLASLLLMVAFMLVSTAKAEFRSAKDMQKECRVALQVMNGTVEKNFETFYLRGNASGTSKAQSALHSRSLKTRQGTRSAFPTTYRLMT